MSCLRSRDRQVVIGNPGNMVRPMYELLSDIKEKGFLGLRISLGLSDKEHQELERLLKRQAEKHGRIRLLLVLEDYHGADFAETFYEDLKFVKIAQDEIDRAVVVGTHVWPETWTGLFSLFGGVEASYFEISDLDKAIMWLDRSS